MKEARKARRVNVTGHLYFSGDEIEGEGQVLDLSTTGCKVDSETNVAVGLELLLALVLPDHPWPVQVERAIVRWVQGSTFGLEFLTIRPAQVHRLRLLIMKTR